MNLDKLRKLIMLYAIRFQNQISRIHRVDWVPIKKPNITKSPADSRDFKYVAGRGPLAAGMFDLFPYIGKIKSQGAIGSCGSHAIITAYEILLRKESPKWFIEGSELAHYYQVRKLIGTFPNDSGQDLRSGLKIMNHQGMCPEAFNPYNVNRYNQEPVNLGWGRFWKISKYERVFSVDSMKEALLLKRPVVLATGFWKDFVDYHGGVLDKVPEKMLRGGHAVVAIGWNSKEKNFLILNSWGADWGDGGFAIISEAVMKRVFWEAWVMSL